MCLTNEELHEVDALIIGLQQTQRDDPPGRLVNFCGEAANYLRYLRIEYDKVKRNENAQRQRATHAEEVWHRYRDMFGSQPQETWHATTMCSGCHTFLTRCRCGREHATMICVDPSECPVCTPVEGRQVRDTLVGERRSR